MLNDRDHGYAVMNKELTAYTIEDISIDVCKKYCRNGDVIVRRVPYVSGFDLKVNWFKWHDPITLKGSFKNILWLHWSIHKSYTHKIGEIVYRS